MAQESVKIVVLVDATGSMGSYCSSVGSTLKQIFVMLDILFEGTAKVEVMAYEDYCDGNRVFRQCDGTNRELLVKFAYNLQAGGGGDCPEAVKTALNECLNGLLNSGGVPASRTIVLHYTDAPPHHKTISGSQDCNLNKEIAALKDSQIGFDWVKICAALRQCQTRVVTFLSHSQKASTTSRFLALLGDVVLLRDTAPNTITESTMGVLLRLMDQPFDKVKVEHFQYEPDLAALDDENSQAFKDLVQHGAVTEADICFPAHQAFKKDLRLLKPRFQESEAFQDLVMASLKDLFVPDCVLALTYNSVLGSLWRLVCKRREDERVQTLCDALSKCCQALSGESQQRLRTWIDESYDQLEEIQELVMAVPEPLTKGILVLDVRRGELPSKEEMRSLMHAPTPGVLGKVQGLLTRLMLVQRGELPRLDDTPMFIPLGLADKDLFATLSHLLLPGMMVSLRPAAMMAILAYLSGHAVLRPRAEAFLEAWKGNWIPPIEKVEDYPEILNAEFVRLVVRVPELLTDKELKLYNHLHLITRIRRAAPLKIDVEVGFTPRMAELTADTKRRCSRCGHCRSFTLMVDDVCGLCLREADPSQSKSNRAKPVEMPEPAEDASHMVECRSCKALYAVVEVDALNVAPKCHYCRQNERFQGVTCSSCGNKYCAPTTADRVEHFVCAPCTKASKPCCPAREAPFKEFAEANPDLLCLFGLGRDTRKLIFDRLGLYKLWIGHQEKLIALERATLKSLIWDGKPVLNTAKVQEDLQDRVLHGRLSATCSLCFEERALLAVQSACGHCTALACGDCLKSWYGQLAPGRLYVPAEGLCPFCKKTPKAQTLRSFNRLACRLAGRGKLELRADTYYGWCGSCFQIKEAMPRVCAQDAPNLTAFRCADCEEVRMARELEAAAGGGAKALPDRVKECPTCRIPTVKSYGCDHMSCPCGAHWCWRCGGAFGEQHIYDHMEEAHGDMSYEDVSDFED